MPDTRHVHTTYDPENQVWWTESDGLPGLASEAPTLDELVERVVSVARELLIANGAAPDGVTLEFITTRRVHMAEFSVGKTYHRELIRLLQDVSCAYVRPA